MKRLVCIILALMILLCACGSEASDKAVDLSALTEDMRAATALPAMLSIRSGDERAERGFAAISDLDYDKVDAYSLLYAADGTAYELAVIRLKDEGDSAAMEASLRAHIDSRAETYRTYNPEQVPRAESAVIASHGRYVALIMCDDPAAVKAVFDRAFG